MPDEDQHGAAASLCILSGRSIAFSPEWPDDGVSVLFDRNSGDYWVVSTLARALVRHASKAGTVDTASMITHATRRLSADDGFDGRAESVLAVLSELAQLGILAQTAASSPTGLHNTRHNPTID